MYHDCFESLKNQCILIGKIYHNTDNQRIILRIITLKTLSFITSVIKWGFCLVFHSFIDLEKK